MVNVAISSVSMKVGLGSPGLESSGSKAKDFGPYMIIKEEKINGAESRQKLCHQL